MEFYLAEMEREPMSEKDSNRSEHHGMQQVSDSDLPLISVILPVYNIRSYLPACME